MRNNQPVTQREYGIPDGVTLMSTTDVESHITYANQAFVHVSGYERDELMGQPHNLLRHPDMPPAALRRHVGDPEGGAKLDGAGEEPAQKW
jgi:aerotaxis receptor